MTEQPDPTAVKSRKAAPAKVVERSREVAERSRLWVVNQDPASRKGATIGWVRRYQAADGQLYAVLLAAYILLTVVPAMLIVSSFVSGDPNALADRLQQRLGLSGTTNAFLHGVLAGTGTHKLSAVVIGLIDLFFFGLGFGRVLQLVHARSWHIDLRKNVIVDQSLYFGVLAAVMVMTTLFLVQARALKGDPSWIGWVLDLVWLTALFAFFVWAPWELLHREVPIRDIVPGAIFTILGFVFMRLISSLLLTHWLNWYSQTYGALGIVMAIFFWLIIIATIMVLAAALSPALAHRRDLREGRITASPEFGNT